MTDCFRTPNARMSGRWADELRLAAEPRLQDESTDDLGGKAACRKPADLPGILTL
jgi:hypothetical protein